MAQSMAIPPKPKETDFEKPVAWLLGRQLIASLKWMALYTAYKDKLDPRDWMQANKPLKFAVNEDAGDDFWFDYLADTGDGEMAAYSVAYLCMSELFVSAGSVTVKGSTVELEPKELAGMARLPRGQFLFVGGDTAYHISDYATLHLRFQIPFHWAFKDLQDRGHITEEPRRPLLGIPGNHDYYDQLDGFNRQFRRPCTGDGVEIPRPVRFPGAPSVDEKPRPPQLAIPGFVRVQEASYVAVKLPYGWWFWGMDTEEGKIDIRQQMYFRGANAAGDPEGPPPARLIVATPEPTTVFGQYAPTDSEVAKTFLRLGLERPFLAPSENGLVENIPPDRCRLDLSGDVHHYARYLSQPGNYASVVAGLGGAFLHPSQTDVGEVPAQARYPEKSESRRAVSQRLLNPWNIFRGGYVWLFGAIVALILYVGATVPQSSTTAVDQTVGRLAGSYWDRGPVLNGGFPPLAETETDWGPWGSWTTCVLLSLGILVAVLLYCKSLYKHHNHEAHKDRPVTFGDYFEKPIVLPVLLTLASGLVFVLGIRLASSFPLPSFGCSLLILSSVVWSVLALVQQAIYSGWLAQEVRDRTITKWHYWPDWVLLILAAVVVGNGTLTFGRYPAAYLLFDMLFAVTVLAVFLGLIGLAVWVGGQLRGPGGKIGFFGLGLWHAVLQLAVPLLLVKVGGWTAVVLAMVSVPCVAWLAIRVARRTSASPSLFAGVQLLLWLAHGGLLLFLPFWFPGPLLDDSLGWWKVVITGAVVAVLGLVLTCAWSGWYFSVSLAFNGHNNECGGGARLEKFRGFIRFRLSKGGRLTGYVIGIHYPKANGWELEPKLVDVFHVAS